MNLTDVSQRRKSTCAEPRRRKATRTPSLVLWHGKCRGCDVWNDKVEGLMEVRMAQHGGVSQHRDGECLSVLC